MTTVVLLPLNPIRPGDIVIWLCKDNFTLFSDETFFIDVSRE